MVIIPVKTERATGPPNAAFEAALVLGFADELEPDDAAERIGVADDAAATEIGQSRVTQFIQTDARAMLVRALDTAEEAALIAELTPTDALLMTESMAEGTLPTSEVATGSLSSLL